MSIYIDIHTHFGGVPLKQRSGFFRLTSVEPDEYLALNEESFKEALSVGVHPWRATEKSIKDEIQKIDEIAKDKMIYAIGEAGIDRVCKTLSVQEQEALFIEQIKIANEYEIPLIIHQVKSSSDIARLRKKNPSCAWIIHGFIGSREEALSLQKLNISLSPGIALLWCRGVRQHKLFDELKYFSRELLYMESDGSTHSIEDVYKTVAHYTNQDTEQLKKDILTNFKRDFKNPLSYLSKESI